MGDVVVRKVNCWGLRWTGRFAKTVGTMGVDKFSGKV